MVNKCDILHCPVVCLCCVDSGLVACTGHLRSLIIPHIPTISCVHAMLAWHHAASPLVTSSVSPGELYYYELLNISCASVLVASDQCMVVELVKYITIVFCIFCLLGHVISIIYIRFLLHSCSDITYSKAFSFSAKDIKRQIIMAYIK